MHAHFTATSGTTYTIWKAAVALPPADFDSIHGGWRLSVQIFRHYAAFGAGGNLYICWNYWLPQKLLSTQQYSKNVPKMIQQSNWLGEGPNSRISSGGWGAYLNTEDNLQYGVGRVQLAYTFAYLGLLPRYVKYATINRG